MDHILSDKSISSLPESGQQDVDINKYTSTADSVQPSGDADHGPEEDILPQDVDYSKVCAQLHASCLEQLMACLNEVTIPSHLGRY